MKFSTFAVENEPHLVSTIFLVRYISWERNGKLQEGKGYVPHLSML